MGGLGIMNPCESSAEEFIMSERLTKPLVEIIYRQETTLNAYDRVNVKNLYLQAKADKDTRQKEERDNIKELLNDKMRRTIDLLQEKGAGSWLTALPIRCIGFALNKQEFRDGIHLRYGWRIHDTPTHCNCGSSNTVEHVLNCKVGGFVSMRHDRLRDLQANFLKEVAKDVKIEPELLPVGNTDMIGTNAEKARLDISAVGLWGPLERTFFDVRVMHPNSPSYRSKTPSQLYLQHEREKKSKYMERVVQIEKGSFTPLVYSTHGGMGVEAAKFIKRVAELISIKRNEEYKDVINFLRTRLRFSILRSTLIAVRGVRGRKYERDNVSDVLFNLAQTPEE